MTRGEFQSRLALRRRPKRLKRFVHPDAQARTYAKRMKRITAEMHAIAIEEFTKKVKPFALGITHDKSEDDPVGQARDSAEERFNKRWPRARIATIVDKALTDINRFHEKQFNAQMHEAVGVDVIGAEPWLLPEIHQNTTQNVSLIRSISSRYFHEIETEVHGDIAKGVRWEVMAKSLEERYGVANSRAELIARDQSGKFYGQLNATRQQNLGITSFTWETMNDERVRDEHVALQGKEFTYARPPGDGLPGEAVNCRCYASPVLAGFSNDVAEAA